jgi:TPR repeat protein
MSRNVLNTPPVVLLPIVLLALAVCCVPSREADAPRTGGARQTGRDRACGGIPYSLDAAKTGAQAGDPMYMSILSERYACGAGVQQNMAEAFRWAMDAAKKDYTPAMCIVGGLYEDGQGVTKSTQIAGEWYRRASDKGDSNAYQRYQHLYDRGLYRAESENEGEAMQLFEKGMQAFAQRGYDISLANSKRAAELGLSWATVSVGTHYEFGDGVPKNAHTALEWYWAAAKSGNKDGAKHWDTLSTQLQAQANAPPPGCPRPPMMYPGVAHDVHGRETPVSTLTWGFCHRFPKCVYYVPGIGQIRCP